MSANFGSFPAGAAGSSFNPRTAAVPCSTVELSFSCSDLTNADLFSKSDPFLVIQLQDPRTKTYMEIFRTETIQVINYQLKKQVGLCPLIPLTALYIQLSVRQGCIYINCRLFSRLAEFLDCWI